MLEIVIKKFEDFSVEELYQVLKIRSQVFVVEQNCVYQDLDGNDQKAIHIFGKKNNEIVAYSRIFKSGNYFEKASIGRVVVAKKYRKNKYGHQLLKASIQAVKNYFNETNIQISAQVYLKDFYKTHGFQCVGEEYLEDNLPHISMVL